MIWRIALTLLVLLCAGCERDSHKPQAQLDYQGVSSKGRGLYVIHYTADMDLLNIFSRAEGEGQLSTMLICSLEGDPVFTREHIIEKKFDGVIGINGTTPGPPFLYATEGTFNYVHNKQGDTRDFEPLALKQLLQKRQYVVCKAMITVFGYTGYQSKPMRIPTTDIQREIDKP